MANGKLSRKQRRAQRRLGEKLAAYEAMCKSAGKNGSVGFTKPGNGRCW